MISRTLRGTSDAAGPHGRGASPPYLAVMRFALALCLLAGPLHAWEFTADPVCTLSHETEAASVRVTHDPAIPEYAITITRAGAAWPGGPVFAIRFDGPRGLTISTTRHRLGEAGRALTVTDRGFGNVLDGLQFNDTATALLGDAAVAFPLDGAAEPVGRFRACVAAPVA